MKLCIPIFSALASVVAPCLHAAPQAVQGIDKTASEVRIRYADGVLALRPLADDTVLARWFQWSTFCPILRVHGFGTETGMWKWLPGTQKVLLAYDELRYRMLPYS